jgi:hypothetical protein
MIDAAEATGAPAFVAHDPATGKAFGLNPVAHFMLLKLKEGFDAAGVASALAAEFDGTEGQDLERHVRDFVAGLVTRGLLDPTDVF